MSRFLKSVFSLLMPKSCVVCGGRLNSDEEVLCPTCNLHLPRTQYARTAADNNMAALFWGLMPVEKCTALFFYKSHHPISKAIYELKYGDRPEIGEQLGYFAASELREEGFFDGIDILLPMPLAANRLQKRGYNQSFWIARGISEVTRLPVVDKVVRRADFKGSQTRKNRWQRMNNVEAAFTLRRPEAVRGKHILIVDDIVTTGATVMALGNELLKAGGVTLSVFSLGFTND